MRIAGHFVPVANVPAAMASEAGHLLCNEIGEITGGDMPDVLFAATYYDGADGRRHFSLRSPEGGADVGQIAKGMAVEFNKRWADTGRQGRNYNGGGHVHAAGFDAPLGWDGE